MPSIILSLLFSLYSSTIAGTGIPLSLFCYSYYVALLFVLVANPWVCFWGAVNKARKGAGGWTQAFETVESYEAFLAKVAEQYVEHLLRPDDWFSYWRLNCRLIRY